MHQRAPLLLTAVLVLASGAAGGLVATPVHAHTGLLASSPTEGERLQEAPAHIVLEFPEPVSAAGTSIRVVDGSGAPRSAAVLLSHTRSVVSVVVAEGGAAGVWQVRFDVRGQDGHVLAGGFDFGVDAQAARANAVLPLLPATAGTVAALGAALFVLRGWARRSTDPTT